MTLAKPDIVNSIIQNVRLKKRQKRKQQYLFPEMDYEVFTRDQATRIVNSLFEIVKESLAKGEDVHIRGFGKFQVKFKWARKGRNPQTGEEIILRSRRIVTFRASPKLRENLNA